MSSSFENSPSRRLSAIPAMALAMVVACSGCGTFGGDEGDRYDGGLDTLFSGLMPPAAIPGATVAGQSTLTQPEDAGTASEPGAGQAESADAGDSGEASASEGFDPLPSTVVPDGAIPLLGEDGEPLLRTGLTVSVSVSVADKVEVPPQVRLISPDNTVQLPYVGVVSCEGLTLSQFNARLTELYGDYLHDPIVRSEFVTTGDAESPWGKVRVMGHVNREGWINIPPTRDLSLLSALQRAGGVAKGAKRTRVRVTRNLPDGTKKVFSADLDKMGKDGDESQDIPLEPGDTVWVEERVW